MTPDPPMSSGLFVPLVVAGVLYVVLLLAANVLDRRGSQYAPLARNLAFLCILAAAVYAVVLAIVVFVSKFAVVEDFIYVTLVIVAFFVVLVLVLLLVEMLVGVIGRRRRRS